MARDDRAERVLGADPNAHARAAPTDEIESVVDRCRTRSRRRSGAPTSRRSGARSRRCHCSSAMRSCSASSAASRTRSSPARSPCPGPRSSRFSSAPGSGAGAAPTVYASLTGASWLEALARVVRRRQRARRGEGRRARRRCGGRRRRRGRRAAGAREPSSALAGSGDADGSPTGAAAPRSPVAEPGSSFRAAQVVPCPGRRPGRGAARRRPAPTAREADVRGSDGGTTAARRASHRERDERGDPARPAREWSDAGARPAARAPAAAADAGSARARLGRRGLRRTGLGAAAAPATGGSAEGRSGDRRSGVPDGG